MAVFIRSHSRRARIGVLKLASALLAPLVSLFCRGINGPVPVYGVAEYGMPWARYTVSGTVRDASTSQPVAGIRLELGDTASAYASDTALTDSLGRYGLSTTGFPGDVAMRVRAEDIDGPLQGEFGARDTVITFRETDLSGGDGSWYAGSAEKSIDLSLEPLQ